MDRLTQMLNMQRELQVKSYGQDPGGMEMNDKIQFIKDMKLALEAELQEALDETDWKPWTHGERQINGDGYRKELVDCWHFFMNLMLAVNMTTEELYKMYVKKRQVNADRQANAYDGRSTKCVGCKRALEDVTLFMVKKPGTNITELVLCQCNAPVDLRVAAPFITD